MSKNYEKVTIIKSKGSPLSFDWREILDRKDLIYYLTWRDIKVRYKQTVLGIVWIVLQPLVSMVLFTFVFGNFAKIPSDGIPYPLFVYIGLIFWNFFSSTITNASNALIANESILKKVYFPRIIAPISATMSSIIDLLPTLFILVILILIFGVRVNLLAILMTPLLFGMTFAAGAGIGLFLAPLNAKFRDVRYVLPYFIQLGLFATPVIYSSTLFGGTSRLLRVINPVAEAIEVYRSVLFQNRPIEPEVLLASLAVTIFTLLFGVYFFKLNEKKFIDIL